MTWKSMDEIDKMDTTEKAVLPDASNGRGSSDKRPGLSDGKVGSARGGDVENGLGGPGKCHFFVWFERQGHVDVVYGIMLILGILLRYGYRSTR